jgi:hypothetical protein
MGFRGASAELIAAAVAAGRVTPVNNVGVNAAAFAGQYAAGLPLSEAAFQHRVIDLAHGLGWSVGHLRKVRVQRGDSTYWETPIAADGAGLPDLLLCRERLLWAELKTDDPRRQLEPPQEAWRDRFIRAGVEWYLWRPSDWPRVVEVLR